ncbi:Abi family protein [Pseudoduganella sp. SL102]|uniref:Abi family protein n=1 Tax=Pseudoduganella sp. SL102 TaxID=2995154 RepID=UPI00248CF1F3|nr:Abi family protein [Pseudoduganella sp. SL102]WBS03006.1 Abi family protein [Pseudoduganella sp. SL102]
MRRYPNLVNIAFNNATCSNREREIVQSTGGFSTSMVFTLIPYTKPSRTARQLIGKLQTQGLVVNDIPSTEAFLGRVNYYRFRGYLYPYFDRAKARPWQFAAGTNVEQARQMYCFDEELRHLLFDVLSQIEVLFRTKLDATMSLASGDGFWYLEQKWFHRQRYPQRIIDSLHADFTRSKEEFAQHYHRSYYNQISSSHKGLPPFWVVADLTTLGQIREIFRALDQHAKAFGHTAG